MKRKYFKWGDDMNGNEKILQILNGNDWVALFEQENGDIEKSDVVCFALTLDDNGLNFVEPMCFDMGGSGVNFVSHVVNFIGIEKK